MVSDESVADQRSAGTILLNAVRHRLVTFVAVAIGVTAAILVIVAMAPSRYDAEAIVGFAPTAELPATIDEVRLRAAEAAVLATSRPLLSATEKATGAASGTLTSDDVHAELVPDTGMVQLLVSDGDPESAAALAEALAAQVVAENGGDGLRAQVIKGAEVPTSAAAPATGLYSFAALLSGLGLGVAVVVGLEEWRRVSAPDRTSHESRRNRAARRRPLNHRAKSTPPAAPRLDSR